MKTLAIVIGALGLVLGAGYLAMSSNNQAVAPGEVAELVPEEAFVPTQAEESPLAAEPALTALEEEGALATVGSYAPYDAEKIAQSDAKHILLFFHATWCPSCRKLDAEITQKAAMIPAGVEIYRLDFDTETELKRKYGITTQHSVIEINAAGAAVGTVTRPATLENILTAL